MTGERSGIAPVCPVCGFDELDEPPWEDESPSDEVCPSCGTHFGYDDAAGGDAARRQHVHQRLRAAWKAAGCAWFSSERRPPAGWDPAKQLAIVEDDAGG